jgi:hypothetical protein
MGLSGVSGNQGTWTAYGDILALDEMMVSYSSLRTVDSAFFIWNFIFLSITCLS